MPDIQHSSLTGTDLHASKIDVVSGVPASTPSYVGQTYWDQIGKKLYVAAGTTSAADWSTTSPSALSITNSTTVNLTLTGPINAQSLQADVILSAITIPSSQITDFETAVSNNPDVQNAIANTHTPVSLWSSGGFSPSSSVRGLELNAAGQIMRLSQDLSSTGNPVFTLLTASNMVVQNQGVLQLNELNINGSEYVALRGPASLSSSYTITLPSSPPTTGAALTYDGVNYVWASGTSNIGVSAIGNNVSSPSNVTGLLLDGSLIRSAYINYNVYRATSLEELAEAGTILAVYKTLTNTWEIDPVYAGKAWINFSITTGGQIQYTTSGMSGSGYVGQMKFNYTVLTV